MEFQQWQSAKPTRDFGGGEGDRILRAEELFPVALIRHTYLLELPKHRLSLLSHSTCCVTPDAPQPYALSRCWPGWHVLIRKELRLLQSGGGARRKGEKKNEGNERNEVSGLVWCRDGKGWENVRYMFSCGWMRLRKAMWDTDVE